MAKKSFLPRGIRTWGATLTLAAAALLAGTGCDDEAALQTFRDASSTNLKAGLNSIMDGIIDGMFAAFEIGTDQSDTTGTSS